MTVSELIEELRKYPGDMPVAVRAHEDRDYLGNVGLFDTKLFYNPENDFYSELTYKEVDKKTPVLVII